GAGIRTLIQDLRQAGRLLDSANSGLGAQRQDNQDQAAFMAQELPQATADLGVEQQRGAGLVYDATGNLEAAGNFKVPGADHLVARINRHAAVISSAGDATSLAGAVAWLRVDEQRLDQAMVAAMPQKAVYISTGRQELRAYDHGKLAQEALVTTGRPE